MDTPSAKTRYGNFELLKIISMFFVVSLHICTQSGISDDPISLADGIFFIIMSEFGRTACTVFVMVSAWFLSASSFKIERLMRVWLKTLIYIILVYFLIYHSYEMPWYDFFPIGGGILWFISAYICLLLFSPVLNAALSCCSRQYIAATILIIGVPMLFFPTISLSDGFLGNNVIWFIWLYLLMGYLRKYPVSLFEERRIMLIVFLALCFIRIFPRIEVRWSGRLPFMEAWMPYLDWWRDVFWTIPSFLTALSLFFIFAGLRISSHKVLIFFGSHTLATYILHQMPFFYEYLWNGIFQCRHYAGTALELPYLLLVIISVFLFTATIDLIFDKVLFDHIVHNLQLLCRKFNTLLQEPQ